VHQIIGERIIIVNEKNSFHIKRLRLRLRLCLKPLIYYILLVVRFREQNRLLFQHRLDSVVLDFWINFNNTSSNPIINNLNDSGTSITSYTYKAGDNNVSVEHYKIINGEHVWFDVNFNGKNTGQLIWDFFSKYDINGLIN